MGTRERKQRAFEQREQFFVEQARELIGREGLLNLQMTRLADQCEYAVGTLYQHFASKEDLIIEIACADFKEHVDLARRVAAWPARSRDRVVALALTDAVFVGLKPDHFSLIQYAFCDVVWRAATPERRAKVIATQLPGTSIGVRIVEDAVAEGDLELHGLTPVEAAVSFGSLLAGSHTFLRSESFMHAFAVSDPKRVLCRHVQALLNGLQWKPIVDPHDIAALDALIDRIVDEVFHDCCQR
jgi:AcrR family transcriptional regulator